MSQLSRRSLVAGAAVLPLSAVPAVPAPWTIATAVCEAVGAAEAAMFKWKEQNPTPELRWIEGEDDVDGASQKYKAARSAWERKHHTAEAECGYDAAHTAEGAVCNEIERLTDALANTPPHSLRAIKIKAAVALQPDYGLEADLAWSIVEDIDRLLTA